MKRFLILTAAVFGQLLATVPLQATSLHLASGSVRVPASLDVRTWIDGMVAVTELTETFTLKGVTIPQSGLEAVIVGSDSPNRTILSVEVGLNGKWTTMETRLRSTVSEGSDRSWFATQLIQFQKSSLVINALIPMGPTKTITTRITYAEALPATECGVLYSPPTRVSTEGREWSPNSWVVQISANARISRITSTHDDHGMVLPNQQTGVFILRDSRSLDNSKPLSLLIEVDGLSDEPALTIGWLNDQAYGIVTSRTVCAPVLLPTGPRRVWIMIDDRFFGHESYHDFKKLCLETIEQIRDEDDFDVFLYDGESEYHSWKAQNKSPFSDAQAAGAWMMQSNGFTNGGPPPQPAAWLLSQPPAEIQDLDVIFLTYETSTKPASISESQAVALLEHGIRFHTLARSSGGGTEQAFQLAAALTRGTCTFDADMTDLPGVVRRTMKAIRHGENRVLEARSTDRSFDIALPYPTGVVDAASPGVLATRIQRWEETVVTADGVYKGEPHQWTISVDPRSIHGYSLHVPLLWANAFITTLRALQIELLAVPSAARELDQQIDMLSLEFNIASTSVYYVSPTTP